MLNFQEGLLNQDGSTVETDDKKKCKSNTTDTTFSSEEILEIQTKDINEQTLILCKFFAKVFIKMCSLQKISKRNGTHPEKNSLSWLKKPRKLSARSKPGLKTEEDRWLIGGLCQIMQ